MNKIATIFIILSLWVSFSYAQDAENKDQNAVSPIDPVLTLTDEDKAAIKSLREFMSKQPKNLKEELSLYRAHIANLRQERQYYYEDLSDEAKDFLKKEREMKSKLSENARKEFYRKNGIYMSRF